MLQMLHNNKNPQYKFLSVHLEKISNAFCPTWKALLSQSTEHDVMLPIQCKFPEIRWVSFSQQPNTSYGLFLTRDSNV